MTVAAQSVAERWKIRIERAEALVSTRPEAADRLRFYAILARWQASTAEALERSMPPAAPARAPLPREAYPLLRRGDLDPALLLSYTRGLLDVLARGPEPLRAFAGALRDDDSLARRVLWAYPVGEMDLLAADAGLSLAVVQFTGQEAWRPLLEVMGLRARSQIDTVNWYEPFCPHCGGAPLCSYLLGSGEPRGQRLLVCAQCLFEWPFRRLRCPDCGAEEDGVFSPLQAEQYPAIRLDACEQCRCYLKTADQREDGHIVPIVDDIATIALDIWAEGQGLHRPAPPIVR